MTHSPAHQARGHASAFARVALLLYALLVVYASLYPFSGWRDNGLPPWFWFGQRMPRYWTGFDLVTNVFAYVPLGALAVLALYPLLRGAAALCAALAGGALLSALLEATQTFLPSRVPSNLDLITNATGVAIGALAGVATCRLFLEEGRLRTLRHEWFSDQASRGLVVVGLWPLAQVYPQAGLFGHGQWLPLLSGWLAEWQETPVDLNLLLWDSASISVEHYLAAEAIVTGCGLAGAVLTLLCQLRGKAPKLALALALVGAAFGVKAMASAVLFSPADAFSWLTPSAVGGLLVGGVMLAGLAFAPPQAQRRAAILALATGLLAANLEPVNPYFLATLQEWAQGKFLNFNGAARLLTLAWPFVALWFLTHPSHRVKGA